MATTTEKQGINDAAKLIIAALVLPTMLDEQTPAQKEKITSRFHVAACAALLAADQFIQTAAKTEGLEITTVRDRMTGIESTEEPIHINARKYTFIVEPAGEGETGYTGYVAEFPGANSQGETERECYANLMDAVGMLTREGWK
jgi:predicted RNase H-like HicB family nuclease